MLKSSSSNFDGEIETANLVDGQNLENIYCRQGARHCYIFLGGNGLVSDSKKSPFISNSVFKKKALPVNDRRIAKF